MTKRNFRGRPKKKKAKGGAPGMPGGGGGALMAQFQQMQADMAKAQEELADKTTSVTAGGGAIEIEITGHQRLVSMKIDPDVIGVEMEADDLEMLQDMLVAGVNAAIEKSQSMSAERMEGLTGGMGLGDLLGGMGG